MTENSARHTNTEVTARASNAARGAARAGGQTGQHAVEQGKQVVAETGRQARGLATEARGRLAEQAGAQQRKAADGLRGIGDELRLMADKAETGAAGEVVGQASQRVHQVAEWLDRREPGQLLGEVREFGRRHPGMFLAGLAALGVVVGRFTRNIAAETGAGSPGPEVLP